MSDQYEFKLCWIGIAAGGMLLSLWNCSNSPNPGLGDTGVEADGEIGVPADWVCPQGQQCAAACCRPEEICRYETCLPASNNCAQDGDCQDDSYCDSGLCIPYGKGPRGDINPDCTRLIIEKLQQPSLQCVWSAPPAGDPTPGYTAVRHTPLVADFGISKDPNNQPHPSIVFISDNTYRERTPRGCNAEGTLRVIDGATCEEIASVTDPVDRLFAPVTPAIGDLDGDGYPEIVAAAADGGLLAFAWDKASDRFVRRWMSHLADGSDDLQGSSQCLWNAITLVDLTNDGRPEIVFQGGVWSPEGLRLATVPGWIGYGTAVTSVVADVDLDGIPELVAGEGTWHWTGTEFQMESYFQDSGTRGYLAVADFGDFPGKRGDGPGRPEVVVAGNAHIVVQSIGGEEIINQAIPSPSYGGGPPNVADFDGDGLPEIGTAFSDFYAVFDVAESRFLWSQYSKDKSSAQTGSSVFDFNGDGRAEVVYGDECFVRVYDGRTGEVFFSQARYSSTWQENPIVVDADGDFSAEIVMGMSAPCNPGYCGLWDPIFKGLRCELEEDCPGGSCIEGFCRCSSDAECGGTYRCAEPLPDNPDLTKNVCRSKHEGCVAGLRVYRDLKDQWVGSRMIWNQHAYQITNVNEDGTIPKTSEVQPNWAVPGLNNFRQNVQGDLSPQHSPDLTAGGGSFDYTCINGYLTFHARICNRGTGPVASGVDVGFFEGDPTDGNDLCHALTSKNLPPGECEQVACNWQDAGTLTVEITVMVDDDQQRNECLESNNLAFIHNVSCPPT